MYRDNLSIRYIYVSCEFVVPIYSGVSGRVFITRKTFYILSHIREMPKTPQSPNLG